MYHVHVSSATPSRSELDLTAEQRSAIERAHVDLRGAVEAYEKFLGNELRPDEDLAAMNAEELRAAQERVESTETKLWELRERLLGWSRPAWAPPATLVSDWILEDDPGYDDEPDVARR